MLAGIGLRKPITWFAETIFEETWARTVFEGPGKLTFSALTHNDVEFYVNGRFVEYIDTRTRTFEFEYLFDRGSHVVEFRKSAGDSSEFKLSDWRYQPGYEVLLVGNGCSIEGTPSSTLVSPGAELALKAVPVSGNDFVGWTGSLNSDFPSIDIIVESHLALVASCRLVDLGFGNDLSIEDPEKWHWQETDEAGSEALLRVLDYDYYTDAGPMSIRVNGPGLLSVKLFPQDFAATARIEVGGRSILL